MQTLKYYFQKTYPVTPSAGYAQLRIFSGTPDCAYKFRTNLPERSEFTLNGIDSYVQQYVPTSNGSFIFIYSIERLDSKNCKMLNDGTQTLKEATAHSLFLQPVQLQPQYWYEDKVEKSSKASPFVRTLANVASTQHIAWRETKTGSVVINDAARKHELYELSATDYDVLLVSSGDASAAAADDAVLVHQPHLRHGGVYALVIGISNITVSKLFEVTEPNSMSILWLVPQYVVMTLGEVMFSVTGLEFSYSQAPVTMKSVLQACWLLTVAFGNVIVVVVAELKFFKSQASEFFLFAGLMFVDMLIFMWMAHYYIPNDVLHARTLPPERMEMMHDEERSTNGGRGGGGDGSTTSTASIHELEPNLTHLPRYVKFSEID